MAKAAAQKKEAQKSAERFVEATGRRKTSVARVRIQQGKKGMFVINAKPIEDYFQDREYLSIAKASLQKGAGNTGYDISVVVRGGGKHAQAVAVRHGVARAFLHVDPSLRAVLKAPGYLTRDPRMRERKKFGLKRARRARQWRKR